jgi:molybdate transport repressor ModE-like protein
MQIDLRPMLISKGKVVDKTPVDLIWLSGLLKNIRDGDSLVQASKKCGVSYRSAWGKLNVVEEILSLQLILRTKGHGSELTQFGEYLIGFIDGMQADHNKQGILHYDKLMRELNRLKKFEISKWKFYSSSDATIQKAVENVKGFVLKITGSGEALEKLLNQEVDIAGYHVSDEKSSKAIYSRLMKSNIQAFPVMKRTQGLIVKKGNPLNIKSVIDLTNRKIRFMNRQIGSGTRLLLDTLLIAENIKPTDINGYFQEEFTHSAVANAILAGKADAGLGVKNIAIENSLGFIPIKDEIFFIAIHKELALKAQVLKLIRKIRAYSGQTPGYKAVRLNRQISDWL